jgi:hypothetical protein
MLIAPSLLSEEMKEVYTYLNTSGENGYSKPTARNLQNAPDSILKTIIEEFGYVPAENEIIFDTQQLTNLDEVKAELKRRQTAK